MKGELVKLGFGKELAEIYEHINSDKHSLIKGLYEEKTYNKLGNYYKNFDYIINKLLNNELFDKIKFGKPKIPTKNYI